jgi:hypothetical protein
VYTSTAQPYYYCLTFLDIVPPPAPSTLDFRFQLGELLSPIVEQGQCGSCWAIASTAALADRYALMTSQRVTPLSAQYLIMCARGRTVPEDDDDAGGGSGVTGGSGISGVTGGGQSMGGFPVDWDGDGKPDARYMAGLVGCGGGTLAQAWEFLKEYGTLSSACWQYNMQNVTSTMAEPPSSLQCDPVTCPDAGSDAERTPYIYQADEVYFVLGTADQHPHGSEHNLRREIWLLGPATSTMIMYDDFQAYWDKLLEKQLRGAQAVYSWDGKAATKGMHAVRILGWNEVEGVQYWILANSWGAKDPQDLQAWGINGCFLLRRGRNDCALEANVVAGIPRTYPGNLSLYGNARPTLVPLQKSNPRSCAALVAVISPLLEKDFITLESVAHKKFIPLAPPSGVDVQIRQVEECPPQRPHKCPSGLCTPSKFYCWRPGDYSMFEVAPTKSSLKLTNGAPVALAATADGCPDPPAWAIAVAVLAGALFLTSTVFIVLYIQSTRKHSHKNL